MKAIAIEGYGGSEVLQRRGLPRPQPDADELLIRVVAAGVSQLDVQACAGRLSPPIADAFPWVPGFEAAGVVEALGPNTTGFRVGDRVWSVLPCGGAYGQYATVAERWVAPMPPSLLFEEAATLALDGTAAWSALFEVQPPIDGSSTVAVGGAACGAGHLAVQLALAAGARVFAICDEDQRAFVDQLGAIEWFAALADCADALTDLGPRDRVVDAGPVGGENFARHPGARVVPADLTGGAGSVQARIIREGLPRAGFASLDAMVKKRRLRPRLFKILNIAQAIEAQNTLCATGTCGKLALTF